MPLPSPRRLFQFLKSFYARRGKIFKFFLWAFILLFIIPRAFIFTMNHTRYALPDDNSLDLSGRKVLLWKETDQTLYLREYNESGQGKQKNTFIETKIKKFPVIDQSYQTLNLLSAVIMPEGDVVWLERTKGWRYANDADYPDVYKDMDDDILSAKEFLDSPAYIQLYRFTNGETKMIREFKEFDIEVFSRIYFRQLVTMTPEILDTQIGDVHQNQIYAINTSTIAFADYIATDIDSERPTKAAIRWNEVDTTTGEWVVKERERAILNEDYYKKQITDRTEKKSRKISYGYFLVTRNLLSLKNSAPEFVKKYSGSSIIEGDNRITVLMEKNGAKVFFWRKDIYKTSEDCSVQWYFTPPCLRWEEYYVDATVDGKKERIQTVGTMFYFQDGHKYPRFLALLNLSEDGTLITVWNTDYYMIDVRTKKSALIEKQPYGESTRFYSVR